MRNALLLTAAIALVAPGAFALNKTEIDTRVKSTLDKCYAEVRGCREVTKNASGVLVFPEVTKGGIGVGYESGQGALLEQGKTTGYYQTSSASVGATLGVSSKSIVVALRTPEELRKFKQSSGWDLGAEAGVAMLNAGAGGSVDTSNIKESIVGIVFGESGLMADVSLKGSKISPLDTADLDTARGKMR